MDMTLAAYSPIYLTTSLVAVAAWMFVMEPRTSQRAQWWWYLPATTLHELCHFLAVLALGGSARIHLGMRQEADGSVTFGHVTYEGAGGGQLGETLISVAPLLLYFVAAAIAVLKLAHPQPLLHGLGWLVCIFWCLMGASMYSASDWRGTGLLARILVVTSVLSLAMGPIAHVAVGVEMLIGQ